MNYTLVRGQTMMTFKWAGICLITFAIFLIVLAAFGDRSSLVYRYWSRYTSSLERKLRPMFIFTPGRVIAAAQLGVLFVILVLGFTITLPYFFVWVIAAVALPVLYIDDLRRKRLKLIEDQLDGFLLALANALKAIPSIAAAFNSVVPILQPPIKDEVDLACKEMKVGSTLDQSLLHMASRIGSRQVDSALSAVLIGRQVGGNLGRVLESTAAAIREMDRLEGVIRTKTAEGKVQISSRLDAGGNRAPALVHEPRVLQAAPGERLRLARHQGGGRMLGGGDLWARKILAVDI